MPKLDEIVERNANCTESESTRLVVGEHLTKEDDRADDSEHLLENWDCGKTVRLSSVGRAWIGIVA